MRPDWIPRPLPGNEDTFRAFRMVQYCRAPMGVGFNWEAIAVKLSLHGLWTPEIERGLDVCEKIMVNEEQKTRERKAEQKSEPSANKSTPRRRPRRRN